MSTSGTPDDAAHMRRALGLARGGSGQTAPNPLVGAVIVRDHEVVGEGYHARYGDVHAEVAALRAAGEAASGATVYVTLEPCTHAGRTPPCTDALIRAGVRRVVIATRDPHPVARGGAAALHAAGIETTIGIEEEAARELNAVFFHALRSNRPWLTLKLAVSVDGAVRDGARTEGWLTGREARAEVHRMRAASDAVAVGIGTVLADDPLLTVRDAPAPRVAPLRIVFDNGARLPLGSRLVQSVQQGPVCVVASRAPEPGRAAQLADAGVEIIVAETLDAALLALRGRGVRALLVEGGPRLAGAVLTACAAHRLVIFQAPIVLGRGAEPAFAFAPAVTVAGATRWPIVARQPFGGDMMTIYGLSEP